jgi:sugar phosphate isomerase/epimerase
LRQALQTAARLGADGIEIDARSELPPSELSQTGLRQFRKLLDDYRLSVSAVAFPTRRGYEVPDDLERRVFATQAAMRLAYNLGTSVVVNRVGQIPSSDDEPSFARLVESLTALGAIGERVGARIAAIPGGEPPADLARLIQALPDGTMGVDFHPGSLIQGGYSPVSAMDELGAYVLHVHAADAVRETGAPRAVETDLGRGSADFPAVLGQLDAQFNYRGWVTIERRDAADPLTAIGNAVAFMRSL